MQHTHGKALSAAVLGFELDIPEGLGNHLRNYQPARS